MKPLFSPEELAEMTAADAEIEKTFRLTLEDMRLSERLEKSVEFDRLPPEKKARVIAARKYRDKHRAELAEKQRAYNAAYPEKVAARNRAYRESHREEIAAKQRAYREANREEIAAKQRAYYEANREEINAKARARYHSKKQEVICHEDAIDA